MLALVRLNAPPTVVNPLDSVKLPPDDVGAMEMPPTVVIDWAPEGAMAPVYPPETVIELTLTLVSIVQLEFDVPIEHHVVASCPADPLGLQLVLVLQLVLNVKKLADHVFVAAAAGAALSRQSA